MSNPATVFGSLGLSIPCMENGEKDIAVSDEKALGLSFYSRKTGEQVWGFEDPGRLV